MGQRSNAVVLRDAQSSKSLKVLLVFSPRSNTHNTFRSSAQNGGVCMRHGAKSRYCTVEGCKNKQQKGGVCIRHGAKHKQCSSEGCTNIVVNGGVCRKHGAKIKLCKSEGCTNQVKRGGLCKRHGANLLPSVKKSDVDVCEEVTADV